jgi:Holliday junction resolvase
VGRIKNPLKYGIQKEKLVARRLREKGYTVKISRASRGASDIKARGRKRWNIQVKASKSGKICLPPSEKRRIKIQARKERAVPVCAQVIGRRIIFKSLRTDRRLRP